MSRPVLAFAFTALIAIGGAAHAADMAPLDPAEARRAAALAAQLRCLVCQNQSIAESNAELAVDLRRQINEQLRAGRTDREITDFMVARYGDFVLYQPPFKQSTIALWLGPLILAALAAAVLARNLRARRARSEPAALSEDERREAARLLAQDGESKS